MVPQRSKIKNINALLDSLTKDNYETKVTTISGLSHILQWQNVPAEIINFDKDTDTYLMHVNNKTYAVPSKAVFIQIIDVRQKPVSEVSSDGEVIIKKKKKKHSEIGWLFYEKNKA